MFLFLLAGLVLIGCSSEPAELPVNLTEISTEVMLAVAPEATVGDQAETCTDNESGSSMGYHTAQVIAQESECATNGQLSENYFCNQMTGTWWIDLKMDQSGCSPACVVDVYKGTAEINWRCTGAIPQEDAGQAVAKPPTPTAGPVPGTIQEVSFQGITFTYADSLAAGVTPTMVPTESFLMLEGAIIPGHEEFSFENYVLPEPFHQPRLIIYPIDAFAAGNELAPAIFDRQKQLLAEKPAKPEGSIPFLPLFGAGPLMQTQVKYLDFQNGEGVRYLTQFGQAYLPISNRTMFYTFQGLTGDGAYYVAMILPVNHPSLPPDESKIPGGDGEAFANNFESYASEVEEQLDAQDDATFIPNLAWLDALVQSLVIDR